ncbi:unnamed protein product [Linum trigynum]|uniref:Uncharacterized protein n=1 Tax=Linum trigynum TaxID=586398 RepID=A0AAV2DBL0_9ROSI
MFFKVRGVVGEPHHQPGHPPPPPQALCMLLSRRTTAAINHHHCPPGCGDVHWVQQRDSDSNSTRTKWKNLLVSFPPFEDEPGQIPASNFVFDAQE